MLLNIVNQTKTSIKDLTNSDMLIWAILPQNDTLITQNDILRTAYFYRIARFDSITSKWCPQSNIAYSTSIELHRLMWMVNSTLTGMKGVVIVKPGIGLHPPLQHTIREIIDDIPKETNWGIIRGTHDKYFIANPRYSHVYKSNNINEIVQCCYAHDLEVITNDQLTYNAPLDNLNYKQWSISDLHSDLGDIELKIAPLQLSTKVSLTNHQTKNIVYHECYTNSITPLLDKFENSASFSTVDEFKDRLTEFPSNTTWIMGNFIVQTKTYLTVAFNELLLLTATLLSLPESIVWANLYHTPEEIHSTLKIHNLYKGPVV